MAKANQNAVETTPAATVKTIEQLSAGLTAARVAAIKKNAVESALSPYDEAVLVLAGMNKPEEQLWNRFKLQAIKDNAYTEQEATEAKEAGRGNVYSPAKKCIIVKAEKPIYEGEEGSEAVFRTPNDNGLRGRQRIVVRYEDGSEAVRTISGFQKSAVDKADGEGRWLPRFMPVFIIEDKFVAATETVNRYFSKYSGKLDELQNMFIKRMGTNINIAQGAVENFVPSAEALAAYAEKSEDC